MAGHDYDVDDGAPENLAQTLARELKEPKVLLNSDNLVHVGLPPGWTLPEVDYEKVQAHPRRIKTAAQLTNKEAFCEYVRRHCVAGSTTWCSQDQTGAKLAFSALFDDHAVNGGVAGWRGHSASFTPTFSVEWQRWHGAHKQNKSQVEFAAFLEDNQKDLSGGEGYPTGADMLGMALNFQARQDQHFKSAIRQMDGGIRMEFIADADKGTVEAMKVFERFRIAIPVFRDDTARYPLIARLRYRVNSGTLAFHYELIRPDLVFEQSSTALIAFVREGCALPLFFGNPG